MSDLRPPLAPMYSAFGVDAVVTPFGGAAVSARVITGRYQDRLNADGRGNVGSGGSVATLEMIQTIAIRKSEVAALPRNSTLVIGASTFIVDGADEARDDRELRVKVRAA